MRKTSENGLRLIKCFEDCKLEAYLDSAGIPTIGYGHTEGVKMGDVCTQEQADQWLTEDVKHAESEVRKRCEGLSQHQFDALVSFTFNVGVYAFAKSHLCHVIRSGHLTEAGSELCLWVHVTKGGIKEISNGLVIRRGIENFVFNAGYSPAIILWIMDKEGVL